MCSCEMCFLSVSLLYVGQGDHRTDEEGDRCPPASSCDQKHCAAFTEKMPRCRGVNTPNQRPAQLRHTFKLLTQCNEVVYIQSIDTHPPHKCIQNITTHIHTGQTLPLSPKVIWFARPPSHCRKTHERRHTRIPSNIL